MNRQIFKYITNSVFGDSRERAERIIIGLAILVMIFLLFNPTDVINFFNYLAKEVSKILSWL